LGLGPLLLGKLLLQAVFAMDVGKAHIS
jgi:hypothetical protein